MDVEVEGVVAADEALVLLEDTNDKVELEL